MKRLVIFSLLALVVAGMSVVCAGDKVKEVKRTVHNSGLPSRVTVYCFGGFSRKKAVRLAANLRAFYPDVVVADEGIALPADQYYKPRNRYKGTGLFKVLYDVRDGDAVVGLTDYVIYRANDISPTYGIMGVAPVGKFICVVSNKIPKGGVQSDENLCKLALHELGHAFGLPHCPDQHCYMVDAEHRYKLPQSKYFCDKCRKFLNGKGWGIK